MTNKTTPVLKEEAPLTKNDTSATKKSHNEKALDHALKESFPASDPIAPHIEEEEAPSPEKVHVEEVLDEALEESFPASDPVAVSVTKLSETDGEEIGSQKKKSS